MKRAALMTVVTLSLLPLAAPATRADTSQPQGQSCVTLGSGASRVAATVAKPSDCCSGRMQCAQFLSTMAVVRPARDLHT